METQRILMRSLAVAVVLAAVIWTTTEVIEPIISFRRLKEDLPCLKAVIFETERGYFCSDWRQPWVKRKILQFLKDKPKKSQKDLTSTPPPTSTIRDQTRVGETTQAIDRLSTSDQTREGRSTQATDSSTTISDQTIEGQSTQATDRSEKNV
ncbi:C-C motif chemokine 19 [Labeo rohita]|uniref:C-C motif chemokine 19 n=1 Tax=Labeo rohita TaxID=84645 RepID=A0ABQ8LDX8_LABRO|nr:C-C motif chemokine 19 [Labeo rohita]